MRISRRSTAFLASGLALLALLALGIVLVRPGARSPFQRMASPLDLQDARRFSLEPGQGMLYHRPAGQQKRLLPIAAGDACYFEIGGGKQAEFASPFSGETGFFCQLYLQAQEGAEVRLLAEVLRAGKATELLRASHPRRLFKFIRSLRLAAGDRIRFSFAGEGIACISQPLFYRIRPARERRYVFLIGVDTLRGDHVGMAANGRPLTPHMDSLKEEAATFTSCFAQSNWTLPSFMSLFTAQYEFNHLVRHGGTLAADKPWLVEGLRRRFVTVNLNAGGNVSRNFGFARGFDYFSSSPRYGDADGGQALFKDALRLVDDAMLPEAFFFLHTYQVHTPFSPPPEFLHEINPQPRALRLNSLTFGSQRRRFMPVAADLRQSYRELYQAEVLAFDSYLGDFLAALKRRGLYDQSMIIVMSDHGEEFYEHGGWGHGHSMYEELLRVPLIIKFPAGEFAGRRVSAPTGIIDILPTLLDFYGIPARGEADGESLLPLLRGGRLGRAHLLSSVSTCFYIRELPARFAVIAGERKVIFNYDYSGRALSFFAESGPPPRPAALEVYDLRADRGEARNLYPRDDFHRRLRGVLGAIKKRIDLNFRRKGRLPAAGIDDELREQMKTLGYL